MRDNVLQDMNDSSRAFLAVVWPKIRKACSDGDICPVEVLDDSKIAEQLDTLAGIDVWQTKTGIGVRGIASRVQFGDKAWNTFTIRLERQSGIATEYEKRLDAIETGKFIYPYLTVQAYVTNRRDPVLLSCAVVKTKDLYEFIEYRAASGRPLVPRKSTDDKTGQWARFYWVDWRELKTWCKMKPSDEPHIKIWCNKKPASILHGPEGEAVSLAAPWE